MVITLVMLNTDYNIKMPTSGGWKQNFQKTTGGLEGHEDVAEVRKEAGAGFLQETYVCRVTCWTGSFQVFLPSVSFFSSDQPGAVDEKYLKQLEDSLAGAQREVDSNLKPRYRDMEEQEAAMRRRLVNINADIDTILGDIVNLEDILRTIPNGCFNNPPIEQA